MSITNGEKEAFLVNPEASSELGKYVKREQTMFETLQNIGKMNLSLMEWQFLCEEAKNSLDKESYNRMFIAVASGKMLDIATSFAECQAIYGLVKPKGKITEKILDKMETLASSEKEKELVIKWKNRLR